MSTTAILLAADSGDGFSGPKYLASVNGEPMLQAAINNASEWPVDEVLVVLGADADEIIAAIDFKGMTIVIDPGWSEGSASPVRAALDLASRVGTTRRCVVARGDQPGVSSEIIQALVATATEETADAVLPKYRYAVGMPVVLESSLWVHLLGGEGSLDLLDFVASHASAIEEVWFDHLPPTTYATSEDLSRIRR